MAKILFKKQTASNEIIKQKDSTINGLMKDMNLIQKWLTGFCDGKMLDLQTICNDCTNICIRNSIDLYLKKQMVVLFIRLIAIIITNLNS